MNLIKPLSENQFNWFIRALKPKNWFNVAEGGKRAGKNIMGVLAFCALLEEHPNKLHLIGGVSIAAAKLNIVDCDGFGIANYFEGRCREGEYKNRDCLYINTKTGEKIVLISGGGKNGDEKNIKGNTYGMAYITEANECHKNFIKEVFDRTLSSNMRKIIHDLNPKSPTHEYYTEILNFHEEQQKKDEDYGFNYGHFTIADNQSIDDEKLRAVLKTYKKGDLWYKRDILGLRIQAEGLIYKTFAENNEEYMLDELDKERFKINKIIIGGDFGGNKSGTSLTATAFCNNFKRIVVLKSERRDSSKLDDDGLKTMFFEFVRDILDKYDVGIIQCYLDNNENVLIRMLQRYAIGKGLAVKIEGSKKISIIDRIRLVNSLIGQKRIFFIKKECKSLIKALNDALWNPKNDSERLDNGTTDIDSLDSFEYTIERDYKILMMI